MKTFLEIWEDLFGNDPSPKIPTGKSSALFESAARDLRDYVIDLCLLHRCALQCTELKWRYVEESAMANSDYYDFGLYEVQGIQIVYAPIPFRNSSMDIAIEKIYVGRTRRQRQRIDEFVRDYEALWEKSTRNCEYQSLLVEAGRLEKDHSHWEKSNYLIPDAFDLLYGQKLTQIIEGKWQIDLNPHGNQT